MLHRLLLLCMACLTPASPCKTSGSCSLFRSPGPIVAQQPSHDFPPLCDVTHACMRQPSCPALQLVHQPWPTAGALLNLSDDLMPWAALLGTIVSAGQLACEGVQADLHQAWSLFCLSPVPSVVQAAHASLQLRLGGVSYSQHMRRNGAGNTALRGALQQW